MDYGLRDWGTVKKLLELAEADHEGGAILETLRNVEVDSEVLLALFWTLQSLSRH